MIVNAMALTFVLEVDEMARNSQIPLPQPQACGRQSFSRPKWPGEGGEKERLLVRGFTAKPWSTSFLRFSSQDNQPPSWIQSVSY